MSTLERVCPRCAYRTSRLVSRCPLCDVPLQPQERTWTAPRRAVRVALPPGVQGVLDNQVAVTVLDLSPLGACLEHDDPLLPGQECLLNVAQAETASLQLPGRIVWSRAQRVEPAPGRAGWVYRSGIEFRAVGLGVLRALSGYLDRIAGGSPGSLLGTVALRGQ